MPDGVIVYLVVSVIVAMASNVFISRVVVACLVSTAISPFAFAFLCAVTGEKVSAPPVEVFLLFTAAAFVIALVVGALFFVARYVRSRQVSSS